MASSKSVKPKLDTTSNTYVLFLDMLEVASLDNVEQVVGLAEKHQANPVIPRDDNWRSRSQRDRR